VKCEEPHQSFNDLTVEPVFCRNNKIVDQHPRQCDNRRSDPNLYLILKQGPLLPTFSSVLTGGTHLSVLVSLFPHCTRSRPDRKGAAVGEGENGREAPLTSHRLPLLTGEEGTAKGEGLLERRGLKVAHHHLLASAPPLESHGPRGRAAPPSSLHAAVGEPRFAALPSLLRATTRDQRAWGRAPSPFGL
jgi:hypothetical protein